MILVIVKLLFFCLPHDHDNKDGYRGGYRMTTDIFEALKQLYHDAVMTTNVRDHVPIPALHHYETMDLPSQIYAFNKVSLSWK